MKSFIKSNFERFGWQIMNMDYCAKASYTCTDLLFIGQSLCSGEMKGKQWSIKDLQKWPDEAGFHCLVDRLVHMKGQTSLHVTGSIPIGTCRVRRHKYTQVQHLCIFARLLLMQLVTSLSKLPIQTLQMAEGKHQACTCVASLKLKGWL